MKLSTSLFCLVAGSSALFTQTSYAQEARIGERVGYGRDGLTFGLGLGGGNLSCSGDGCDDFTEAGSFNVFVGGMAAPNLAVVFDLWWMVHSEDRLDVSQGLMTANVKYWPMDHLWLRGGIGAARAAYNYNGTFADIEDHTEWVPAFAVGVGVEPIATDTLGLDIKLEYGTGFYSDGDTRIHSLALSLGLSFY